MEANNGNGTHGNDRAPRRSGGRGDLHLGNIVWFDGTPLPFDGIEFDPALRWQDVHGELAFLTMDLARRGRPDLARRVRDRYLQHTGDYDGVPLIDYFEVYRALVRAKVARLRAAGTQQPAKRTAALRECVTCIRLAETLSRLAGERVPADAFQLEKLPSTCG